MSLHPVFQAMVEDMPTALEDEDRIDALVGRTWAEVLASAHDEVMPDGIDPETMRRLIVERGKVLFNNENVAECVSHILHLTAPLADGCDEVDEAIVKVADWLVTLAKDDLLEQIREAKASMAEVSLDEGPGDNATDVEIAAWNELFDSFCEICEHSEISFELGGHDVVLTIEAGATVMLVETRPGTGDMEILCVFVHSDRDDDRDGRDPEPDPIPDRPMLLDA